MPAPNALPGDSIVWSQDTIYSEAECHPEDIFYHGSDDEYYEDGNARKLRYEAAGRRFLDGGLPLMLSATLRGPFDSESGWVNPWRSTRARAPKTKTRSSKKSKSGKKVHRSERRHPEAQDEVECHLPSPESLKQVSVENHPFLEDDDVARVREWRDTVKPSASAPDELLPRTDHSPSARRAALRRTQSQSSGWLRKSSSRKRKAESTEPDPNETPSKRRHRIISTTSTRTPLASIPAPFDNNRTPSRTRVSMGNSSTPWRASTYDQDEDELMDGPKPSSRGSRLFGSPAKRTSPKKAMRMTHSQNPVDSEDELAQDKVADREAAAATLSSPVSDKEVAKKTAAPEPVPRSLEVEQDDIRTDETASKMDADDRMVPTDIVVYQQDSPDLGTQQEEQFPSQVQLSSVGPENQVYTPEVVDERSSSPLSSIESFDHDTWSGISPSADEASEDDKSTRSDADSDIANDGDVQDVIKVTIPGGATDSECHADDEAALHPELDSDSESWSGNIIDSNFQDGIAGDDDEPPAAADPQNAPADITMEDIDDEATETQIAAQLGASQDSSVHDRGPVTDAPEADVESMRETSPLVSNPAPAMRFNTPEHESTPRRTSSSGFSFRGMLKNLVPLSPWSRTQGSEVGSKQPVGHGDDEPRGQPDVKVSIAAPAQVCDTSAAQPLGVDEHTTDEVAPSGAALETTVPDVTNDEASPTAVESEETEPTNMTAIQCNCAPNIGKNAEEGPCSPQAPQTPLKEGMPGLGIFTPMKDDDATSAPDTTARPSTPRSEDVQNKESDSSSTGNTPATTRPCTPPMGFPLKPFSAFMTPSPEHRARQTQRVKLGTFSTLHGPSAMKKPWSSRPSRHVTWAPLPGETNGEAPAPGNDMDDGVKTQERPASPPPATSVEDLPISEKTDFHRHFHAVAMRAGDAGPRLSDSQETLASSPEAEDAVTDKEPITCVPRTRSEEQHNDQEDGMDLTDQVFEDLQSLLQPWDLDAELDQARREPCDVAEIDM